MHRNRFVIALAACLAPVAALAPSALASGKLTVVRSPAGGGTISATIPERTLSGAVTGPRTTIFTCGAACSATVDDYQACSLLTCAEHPDNVRLTQVPAAGWRFTDW